MKSWSIIFFFQALIATYWCSDVMGKGRRTIRLGELLTHVPDNAVIFPPPSTKQDSMDLPLVFLGFSTFSRSGRFSSNSIGKGTDIQMELPDAVQKSLYTYSNLVCASFLGLHLLPQLKFTIFKEENDENQGSPTMNYIKIDAVKSIEQVWFGSEYAQVMMQICHEVPLQTDESTESISQNLKDSWFGKLVDTMKILDYKRWVGEERHLNLHSKPSAECVFCEIADKYPKDQDVIVFPSLKSVNNNHLLAIPRNHAPTDVTKLTAAHIPLIKNLKSACEQEMNHLGMDPAKGIFGFHIPPVTSVPHLHLHCLQPPITSFQYNNDAYPFITFDQVLKTLNDGGKVCPTSISAVFHKLAVYELNRNKA